ncbi:hypothetical protein G6F66_011109 [Rhizopus arrhizus]|nr:hypothetical protein G6F66_011109 [Rhizopus arrhizus]
MSSLNQDNQAISGALTGESQQGNKMMRYVNEPKSFSGYAKYPATAKLLDKEILFIVGDHLVEKAETWWNVVGSKSESWKEFSELFKKQYMVDQEDKWWRQLQTMKQGPQDSIDDVALKMEELFDLLGSMSEAFQVRTFLGAINPTIAFEVEKDETATTFSAAKKKAKQIERSLAKYGANGVVPNRGFTWLKFVLVNCFFFGGKAGTIASQLGATKSLVCFFCDEEGHRKFECPKFLEKQNGRAMNQTPATGSSRALAKRLRLLPNGDTIPFASVDDKRNSNTRNDPRCRSDITLSVPIRVAGKLRPEHMVISDDCEDDTCILGMTWFKQFDVTQKLKENIIIIPTKGGKSRIRLQGKSTIEKPSKQARVYTISIREIEDDKDTNDTNPKYTNNNFDKLITYDEEITGDKEIFDTNPELTATPSSTEENTPEEIKHFIKQFSNSFAENSGLGKISKEYEHIIELKNPNEMIKTVVSTQLVK